MRVIDMKIFFGTVYPPIYVVLGEDRGKELARIGVGTMKCKGTDADNVLNNGCVFPVDIAKLLMKDGKV